MAVQLRTVMRLGLGYLFVTTVVSGAWALFLPSHFWHNFPGLGLQFIAPLPAYNEHLLNDFAGLYLALATLLAVALVQPSLLLVRATLAAFLVYAVPHFVFHATHLEPFQTLEAIALLVLVGSFVLVPGLLLVVSWAAGRSSSRHSTDHRQPAADRG